MKGLPLAAALLLVALPGYSADEPDGSTESVMAPFRPSVAVVVGIFAVMFSLTFLLLIYAKFCHAAAHAAAAARTAAASHDPDLLPRRNPSGVDKTVIESLPFFRFSSLRGSRDGLECAVCLSAFAGAELLRLLPKCKHAFHLDCVDRWLESHSSCPLCRCAVDATDAAAFHRSTSSRFLLPSTRRDGSDLDREIELFVEREPGVSTSSRLSLGWSFRKIENFLRNSKQDPAFPAPVHLRHQLKHRIIVSDVVHKRRWSDVNSADLLSLSSDMLGAVSSERFSDNNGGRLASAAGAPMSIESRSLLSPGVRSASEITNYSRFNGVLGRSGRVGRDEASTAKDEKLKRIWLPIARRTVQLFAGREQSSQTDHQIL